MHVTIISDASYCDKTKAAGFGSWVACKRGKKSYGSILNGATNSGVAEAMGICNALAYAMKGGLIFAGDIVLIQCDATDGLGILKGNTLGQCEVRKKICDWFSNIVTKYKLKITFRHVKGHSKTLDSRSKAQQYCDRLAYDYMQKARSLIRLEKEKKRLAKNKTRNKDKHKDSKSNLKHVCELIENKKVKV
ncbi:Rnase H [Providencia phage PSTCR4]|uniref:Uncharacterized protein n=1 Tax=Providencia phage PSTCR4 TaxID=2783546 RepID=A0A873WX13_9CAUD|nr:Rnase H [Providencia phage PSTCR4]QPB12077.1 hypothetical protein [Providencia phage PSTCR4]